MVISNWLAKADGHEGLVCPKDFTKGNVRIFGNIYGHPDFKDGEYVRTAKIVRYDGIKITTEANEEITLLRETGIYTQFLHAEERGIIVLKNWSVQNGLIVGRTLDGKGVKGRIITQNFSRNLCDLEGGKTVFIDWLAKDPNYIPNRGPEEFLVFATECCMPDVFGKHFTMFRKK